MLDRVHQALREEDDVPEDGDGLVGAGGAVDDLQHEEYPDGGQAGG